MLLSAQTIVSLLPPSERHERVDYALQSKSEGAFLEMLDAAVLYNMPKLLVCCEHHIAANILGQDKMCLPSEYRLEEHVPSMTALRIANALCFELWKCMPYGRHGSLDGRRYLQKSAGFLQMAQSKM
jgi:hypothetical protein